MNDPFRTLNVPKDASIQEVRRAWRRKAMAYHPDRCATDAEREVALQSFKDARAAYEELLRQQAIAELLARIRQHAPQQESTAQTVNATTLPTISTREHTLQHGQPHTLKPEGLPGNRQHITPLDERATFIKLYQETRNLTYKIGRLLAII